MQAPVRESGPCDLTRDLCSANRAVRNADGRIQQPQIIVNFRDRADRRAGAAAGGFLLDRNGGTQAVNGIDVGPLHLVQKLPRIRRQGLHIAALPFRVDSIEGKRAFSGTAETSNDSEAVARNLDVDIPKIVLTRTVDGNALEHEACTSIVEQGLSDLLEPLCRHWLVSRRNRAESRRRREQ